MNYKTFKELIEIANSMSIQLRTVSDLAQLYNTLKRMRVAS